MLFTNTFLLGTAAVASAVNVARELTFPIDVLPDTCNSSCATYKDVFNKCPTDGSSALCQSVCNATILTNLQICINCTLSEGPSHNVTQFQVDVLNAAQQNLAQECVNEQYPATFTGSFVRPTTVAYPAGVDQATFVGANATAPPTASATASVSAIHASQPTDYDQHNSSSNSSGTTSAITPPATSKPAGAATSLSAGSAVVAVVALAAAMAL
ncbi:hypothetical protein A1Q1_04201 [Trichosporon asahii var. asahii CBS 2479]|uniref:Uncharacterized protein n=1 Tax=Trichosporon asahii var. asahii (strain ATCC 90039 / CBS 2479 / JCM 2466 / KCTC 7840 / NBRC 103889/ NCYC 2677 / UAMH 7654) TaxID=1186058 RepID=J5QEL1_TRIAS|nr:hypothetical protein A1Q1_04201 [Trichosporon asahii var. asahii CBS 2479]EJT46958.1 hypothetical protein A1Q1_04201 [Trichosporon asahii var. asahii CBS 2479]